MSLLLRLLGVAVAAGLAGVAAAAVFVPTPEAESMEARRSSGATAAFAPLPAVNVQAPSLILGMSPFAKDRSAFDRATASAPPPAPVEVKLTGIFRVGKELRASLMVNGQSIVVRKGDETAGGKVLKIEAGAVVLSGAIEQRLEMFR
ncbi:MAG: hypothetical protein K9G83_07035 [Hyphomonadaceae bacterium]|nr:hypothetical protein [Hyphomonadaceae bacterium]